MKSTKSNNKTRLSSFGERLQSLSDSFYSTIVDESKETKQIIKNAKQLEDFQSEDFTFDQCSTLNDFSTKDQFSFTFHSIDQTKIKSPKKKSSFHRQLNLCSTPNSIRKSTKCEQEQQTIVVDHQSSNKPMIIGYYPIVTYQPIPLIQSPIYFSNPQLKN